MFNMEKRYRNNIIIIIIIIIIITVITQAVLALMLLCQAVERVATREPTLGHMRKVGFDPDFAALKADNLPLGHQDGTC